LCKRIDFIFLYLFLKLLFSTYSLSNTNRDKILNFYKYVDLIIFRNILLIVRRQFKKQDFINQF